VPELTGRHQGKDDLKEYLHCTMKLASRKDTKLIKRESKTKARSRWGRLSSQISLRSSIQKIRHGYRKSSPTHWRKDQFHLIHICNSPTSAN
jgi:hypothetical protein